MKVEIKEAGSADLPRIMELIRDSIEQLSHRHYSAGQIRAWLGKIQNKERFKLAVAEQVFLIAEVEGQMAGLISLKDRSTIDLLFVSPLFVRKGIAQKLYEKLIEISPLDAGQEVFTFASKTARPFFEKNGFVLSQENKVEIEDEILINYKMKKVMI